MPWCSSEDLTQRQEAQPGPCHPDTMMSSTVLGRVCLLKAVYCNVSPRPSPPLEAHLLQVRVSTWRDFSLGLPLLMEVEQQKEPSALMKAGFSINKQADRGDRREFRLLYFNPHVLDMELSQSSSHLTAYFIPFQRSYMRSHPLRPEGPPSSLPSHVSL